MDVIHSWGCKEPSDTDTDGCPSEHEEYDPSEEESDIDPSCETQMDKIKEEMEDQLSELKSKHEHEMKSGENSLHYKYKPFAYITSDFVDHLTYIVHSSKGSKEKDTRSRQGKRR